MVHVKKLLEYWNERYPSFDCDNDCVEWFSNSVTDTYLEKFWPRQVRQGLSISKLGYPAICTGLDKVLPKKDKTEQSLKQQWIFSVGDYFEAFCYATMYHLGINIYNNQKTVEIFGVEGHIDGTLEDGTVVDFKTMSGNYYEQFVQAPNDDRGYLTQLTLYMEALGQKTGAFICLNKFTNELAYVPIHITWSKCQEALERAEAITNALAEIETLQDVFEWFEAPEPVPEYRYKKKTGKLLLPPSIKYSQYAPYLYEFDSTPRHVLWALEPEEAMSRLLR